MRLRSLALVLLVGCGSDPPKGRPAPHAKGTEQPDASTDPPPTVRLRWNGDLEHAVIDVVARDVSAIHGTAFRLTWDPAKVALGDVTAGTEWSPQAIRVAKEGLPGELVVVWTERGVGGGLNASTEAVLGSIAVTLKTSEPATIAFRPERSTLRNMKDEAITVEWRGTTIP